MKLTDAIKSTAALDDIYRRLDHWCCLLLFILQTLQDGRGSSCTIWSARSGKSVFECNFPTDCAISAAKRPALIGLARVLPVLLRTADVEMLMRFCSSIPTRANQYVNVQNQCRQHRTNIHCWINWNSPRQMQIRSFRVIATSYWSGRFAKVSRRCCSIGKGRHGTRWLFVVVLVLTIVWTCGSQRIALLSVLMLPAKQFCGRLPMLMLTSPNCCGMKTPLLCIITIVLNAGTGAELYSRGPVQIE